MDLDRMLMQCRRDQWVADDLDWSVAPPEMSRDKEMRVVQYFTDMAGIELMAGALFEYQRDHAPNETLREIFDTFVIDEERHSEIAARLARHYNRNHYKIYWANAHLERFRKPFIDLLQHITPEIATYYITTGEIFLDVALLRSLNDFVDDDMSQQAMDKINRDESRHIAMDFYMIDQYVSPEYLERQRRGPKPSLAERARGAKAMAAFMFHAAPFFREVFFETIDAADPSGRRLLQAFKRIQLSGNTPRVQKRPFARFIHGLQDIYNHPKSGPVVQRMSARVLGLDPRVITRLYNEEEAREAWTMTYEEHAAAVLEEKTLN